MATAREYPIVEGYGLSGAYIYPKWLRIELHDGRVVFRQCHCYIVSEANNVDMFRVSGTSGNMERFSIINNVDSVDEVDGPPEPDAAPVEIPSATTAPSTSTAFKDDDVPW